MDNQDIYLSNYSELLNSTISLLDTAERDVTLKDEYRNLVLILGDEANDFSLIQSITGEYTNATATEVGKSSDEFIYEPRQFGNFIFKYQKRCPELLTEAEPNVLYYGCSCFSDFRSTSVDIVNTFITNKVLSHVDRIKIVFTVNYTSLEKGADKGVFMKFLRHVSDFVKDIEKYRKSLALISIGVGEKNSKKDGDSQLIGDIQFKNDISDFLLDVRQHINDKQKDPGISNQDKTFYENALQFINAVLEKDGENYTKIGIFRKLDELNSRSNPGMQKEWKNNIEKIINDELNFTEKLARDFRCSISENSEQNVNNLGEELNNAVWIGVRRISVTVLEHFQNQIQKLLRKLENFASGKTIVEADPVEAISLSFKFKNDYYTITSFVGALQNSFKVKGLVKKIKDFVSTLDISVPDIEIQNISRYGKYFDILEAVSGKEFGTKPWGDLFKSLEEYIFESRKIIENAIDTAVEKVKYRIKLNLSSIANRIQKKYSEEKAKFATKTLEIQKLHDAFLKQYEDIVKLTEDVKRLSTVDSLVKKLQVNSNIPGIVASRRYITNISNEGRCFMFLHFLSEKRLDNGSSTWWKGFQEVSDFVHDSKKWYGFLSDLNIKFSEYNTQIERKKYIDFLKRQTESDVFQETNITPINFGIFLRKIRNLNVVEYDNIMNVSLTESRLKELNQLINFKLKHDITIQCSDTHMFVKGDFVSLQEVRSILLNHNDKKCKEFKYYGPSRKFFNIFALNTLFIDRDIELQASKIQLIYISPRWEIIGKRLINLNGYDSSKHVSTRARDSYKPEIDGDHGNPGKPGGSGGIFFGIGATFVNGDNLTITANGGDGGPGQNGGNGSEGLSGVDVNQPSEERNSVHCCYPKTTEDLESSEMEKRIAGPSEGATFYDLFLKLEALQRRDRMRKIYLQTKNGFGCRGGITRLQDSLSNIGTSIYSQEFYEIYGKPGKKGGNGGDGGKGGIGGNPGMVRIISMENSSGMNTSAIKGKDGAKGEGGKGGNGGKDGDIAFAICTIKKKRSCDWCITVSWVLYERIANDRRGLSGRNGKNGINDTNIENPEPEIFIEEPAKIINKYKIYLSENLTNDLKMFYLKKFYEQMNNNYAVRSVYDLEGFVSEFLDLEDHYDLLKKQVDFYPFYKNLLGRLVEIYECTENCDVSRENKIVLSYFYSAVLSKINSLKENNESDLIIDIEKYFDTIKTEIYLLQDIQNKNSKAKAVDEMKKEFKKRIDEKIQEAKYFIENTVNPEINRINRAIDNKIDLLIIETISLQKQTQIEKNELKKKKEDLKKALKLKKVFNFFKVLGRVISFLGPYGMAIGAAIELGTSVGESFALGNKVKPIDFSNTAAKLNAVENNIRMMRIRKTDYLNNVLTELSEKTFKYPGELGGISSKVTDMKKKLNDIRTGKVQYKEVRKLERDLKDTLKTKEIELKSQVEMTSRDVTKMIKKFGQALEVGSMFVDVYNRNKEDDEKVAAINEAIQQKENELIMLREYEEQIYETLRPALEDMKSNLQVFSNKLNKRSQVALDVGKWQVQTALKDMRIQMQRMTEGMEVKDDLARCLEKLEEAMSMLITIYDRIQQYQNEQILSNHIANVCSVSPSTLSTSDQNLVNVTNNLEWSIRSSLVLKHYQTGLKAFKQWVFPFASHYLEESMIPSHFQLDGNIQSLVNNAAAEIESLKKKIDLYKASARDTDEILIRGEFNCRCISCEAFFAWKDEEYRYEISRLLSGRTIVLKADVKLSEPGKDAIKFKMIKLHLKSKNETLQSQLDETLKMFDVTATHTGNSYYRYHDEIYTITSPKKTIFYSFEENARTGNPVRKNEIYMKFKHGDLMLSPYTMWIFKLNATRGSNFRELDIYKGQIDLELEGEGGYVTNDFGYEDDDYEFDSQLETPVESELKNRIIRSLDRRRSESSVTSGSASSLSSPINSACNLFKTYTLYLITISINKLSNYGGRALKIDTIKNFLMTSMNSVHNELSNEIQKSNISNISRFSLAKSFDTKEEFDLILKNPNFQSNDISCKYSIPKYLIANTKSNNSNENIKSFIFNEQESKYYNQNIQVPDLNHSLLFANFIARSFTGLKYDTELDESLMSPKHLIFKRCNESSIKNENDIIQNFRLFSEKQECIDRSWLSSVKRNVKSVFQYLGLISKEETDECIRDIRNLFV